MLCSHLLDTLFWAVSLVAVVVALMSVKRGRRFLEYVEDRTREPPQEPPSRWPSVALIVPVKGVETGLASNLGSLASQDYPSFELIVCCSDPYDPALEVARATLGQSCSLVIAGEPSSEIGEKIHNLTAAVAAAGDGAEVLVFADSDGQVPPDWLRKLVAPLEDLTLGATTAFRWHFPVEGGFWPLMRSVWDSAIATILDTQDRSFAWGGGTAVRRESFDAAQVPNHWRGAVSDDYRLSDAMQSANLGIRFVPEAMVPTIGQCTRPEFLHWTVRQLTITRVYRFRMWIGGCVTHILYCTAQLLCVLQLLHGNWIGLGALLAIVVPGMAIGGMRAYACALVFPDREAWLERYGWAYFWMTPLATWIWLYAFLRSGMTRRISWRGRTYELRSEREVREVGRT